MDIDVPGTIPDIPGYYVFWYMRTDQDAPGTISGYPKDTKYSGIREQTLLYLGPSSDILSILEY